MYNKKICKLIVTYIGKFKEGRSWWKIGPDWCSADQGVTTGSIIKLTVSKDSVQLEISSDKASNKNFLQILVAI